MWLGEELSKAQKQKHQSSINHVDWAGPTEQDGNNVRMSTEYTGECPRPQLAPTCTAASKAAFTPKGGREL